MHPEMMDEILERVLVMEEAGVTRRLDLNAKHPEFFSEEQVQGMKERELIREQGGILQLTERGRELARGIVRRHRLAERLLRDVLNMEESQSENEACCFEHNLTPGIVDSICTLLGHPRECPHSRPIPEGTCCRQYRESVEAIFTTLSKLKLGERGTVAYLNSKNYNRIKKLHAFGIVPGAMVQLIQRSPSIVMQVDETQIALEKNVAEDIFIRRREE